MITTYMTIKKRLALVAGALLAGALLSWGLFGCSGLLGGAGGSDTSGAGSATGNSAAGNSNGNGSGSSASDGTSASTGDLGQTGQDPQRQTAVAEGSYAPDFTFTTVDGKTAKLSDYKGQVVLLNFWATWCGYCIDEMPSMQQIKEDYPNVVILAINRSDDSSQATAFAKDKGYNFVWGLDDDGAIAKIYPSNGIPYSLIIDKDGVIGTIYEGSAPNMYPYFESALKDAGA